MIPCICLQSRAKEIDQPVYRTAEDSTKTKALTPGGLMEFGLEEESNAADGTNGQVTTSIGHDITAEEVAEVIDNDVAYTGIAQMVVDERRKRGQPAVSHGLAVYSPDDVGEGETYILLEFLARTRVQFFFI